MKNKNITLENEYLKKKGYIFDIQRFSIHDGPGIRTIVFLNGCPLRCKWCANPESQVLRPVLIFNQQKCIRCHTCEISCPKSAIHLGIDQYPKIDRSLCDKCGQCVSSCCTDALYFLGKEVSVEEVMKEFMKDEPFYRNSGGGITLSGGEILVQHDFANALLGTCKGYGLHTTIETTGYSTPEILLKIADKSDLILYDFKHYDPSLHQTYTGVDNKQILNNLKMLVQRGHMIVVRIPVIPGFNNSLEDAKQFGLLLKKIHIEKVNLLPFHQMGENKHILMGLKYHYKGVKGLHEEELVEYQKIMIQLGLDVKLGG